MTENFENFWWKFVKFLWPHIGTNFYDKILIRVSIRNLESQSLETIVKILIFSQILYDQFKIHVFRV